MALINHHERNLLGFDKENFDLECLSEISEDTDYQECSNQSLDNEKADDVVNGGKAIRWAQSKELIRVQDGGFSSCGLNEVLLSLTLFLHN